MAITEIRITGFGGQGVILAAYVIGKAAAVVEGRHATLNQAFGPEARGSACSAQLILSGDPVAYPYVRSVDILVAMSQEAYDKFEPGLRENGILLTEQDLVRAHLPRPKIKAYSVPATRIAEQMGNRMFANMVMLGFLAAVTGLTSRDALHKAIPGFVPDRSLDKNLQALDRGWELGKEQLAS